MKSEGVSMSLCHMRLTGGDRWYYRYQLEGFVAKFSPAKVSSVHFGKQDIRGGVSITLHNLKHCVPYQKFFENKWELLGFVVGFNMAKHTELLNNYLKEVSE